MWTVARYVLGKKLRGEARYPLVLMLEPLFRCNLACAGCGKIQYPAHILKRDLSPEQCFRAAEECGAPIVSIPGGEPLLHPRIVEIVEGLIARKKYVYLCTNALLLKQKIDLFKPSKFLTFSVHMDGLEDEHDFAVCREGTFQIAYEVMRLALQRGFRLMTNTTLFSTARPEKVREFLGEMTKLGVEGMMVSPGYSYSKAPDQEHFLRRSRTRGMFSRILARPRKGWKFNQSPLFLEFLTGARDYPCTPWGMPTYNVFGWQRPCYLLQDGYAETFEQLMKETEWDRYGRGNDDRCSDCMVHCGYEASAVDDTFGSLRGFLAAARATIFGPRTPALHGDTADEPASGPRVARPVGELPVLSSAPLRSEACGSGSTGGCCAEAASPARGSLDVQALAGGGGAAPQTPHGNGSSGVGEGFRWEGDDPVQLAKVIEAAFDYRGDVTLVLDSGEEILGYVADRRLGDGGTAESTLRIFPADGSPPRSVLYRNVRVVAFTGRDPASGKSWEAWVKRYEARKLAGANGEVSVGEKVPFGLFPESMD